MGCGNSGGCGGGSLLPSGESIEACRQRASSQSLAPLWPLTLSAASCSHITNDRGSACAHGSVHRGVEQASMPIVLLALLRCNRHHSRRCFYLVGKNPIDSLYCFARVMLDQLRVVAISTLVMVYIPGRWCQEHL